MSHPSGPGASRVARLSKAPTTRFGGAGQDLSSSEPGLPEAGAYATGPGFAALLDASSLGEPGAVALGSRTSGAQLAEILRRSRLAAEEA